MISTDIAVKIARYSDVKKARVAAVAFETKSGRIIATAHNRRVDGHKFKFSIHAEEAIINKLSRLKAFDRFKRITILVLRIRSGGISMAKPCKMCTKLLSKYNVDVLYSGWDSKIHKG